jgi:hypothetical protein
MDWYESMTEKCADEYNPKDDLWGREWDELTESEKMEIIEDRIAGMADAMEIQ